ncbi:MAG: hypothetical protein GY757_26655, partial [bacterium]|nr:hypothetical protein [bacterium]
MNKQKEKFIIGTQKCPRPPLRLGLPGLPLLLALFILWPTVLCADKWYRDFEKARDAAKAQKWKTVITYIQRALENKPKPNYTAHALAVDVKKYLPYYYLGLANYKLGRFKDADSAFKQTFFYREIESNAQLYAAAKTMAEDCLAKLKLQSQPATVSKPVIRAPKKSQNLRLIKQTITAGDNYSKSGNFAAAGNEYKNAVKLIEESKEAISRLPEVKKKIRSAASAERLEILKISLQNAQRLYDAGQTGDAEKALHKIVRENPGNEKAARLLAHIKNERVKRK